MKSPEKLDWGPARLRRWADNLVLAVRARTPLRSETCEIHETPAGYQPLPQAQRSTVLGAADRQPLELFVTVVDDVQKIGITPSTVHSDTPSNAGDAPPWVLSPVGSAGVVYAKVTDDSSTYVVTDRVIEAAATLPGDTEHVGHEPIGTYTVSGGNLSVANLRYGPIQHINCGASEHFWD